MSRLKGVLLILTLFFVKAEMQKLGKHNFTSEWLLVTKDSLFPPLVTEMKDRLVYISFPREHVIRLETSMIVNKPCEIPSALLKERKSKNVTPVYAETLGNGKIIVSLLEAKKAANQSNVWLYVIDPQKCTFGVDKFNLDAPIATARDIMTLVAYHDTFDVFVRSNLYCESNSICSLRFSEKPMLLSSRNSTIPFDDEGWDISTTKDYDYNEGYLYIVMMSKSNTTIIKRLDKDFVMVQETFMNHSGGGIAYWYDEDGSASLCFGVSDQEIECILLDSKMKVQSEATLLYDNYVQYYSIFRVKNGDAVILTILSTDPDGSDSATYVQLLGKNGKVTEPVKFQEFICENVFEMNTFEVNDELFCASTMCHNVVNTKCIGPADKREF